MTRRIGLRVGVLVAIAALGTGGCALSPRDGFTAIEQDAAVVRGFDDARIWADAPARDIARVIASPALLPSRTHDVNVLALSGGGAGGSFAAGLLNGWSSTGTRPSFDLVTGVSTGALIAPFAFLGPAYDDVLKTLYTGDTASDLAAPSLGKLLSGSGLLDPEPLRRMVEHYANADLLSRIAAEHRRGRRLLVVTTNLDAQRPVLWNLGAIAASGRPEALQLFQDILVASASVPAAFPPVMIDAHGKEAALVEMHVDGGTTMPVFANPDVLLAPSSVMAPGLRRKIHLWLVVNKALSPEFAITGPSLVGIAMRSFSTLMKSQIVGIVGADFEAARRLGIDFNLANIDRPVVYDPKHPFGAAYMDTVYDLGVEESTHGTAWRKAPATAGELASRR